jgi:hypothetical protein
VVETAGSRAEAERIVVNADFAYAQQQLLQVCQALPLFLLSLSFIPGPSSEGGGRRASYLFFARDL